MSSETERLRRLLAEQLGECCGADIQSRLDELQSLTAAVPDGAARDRDALGTLSDDTRYRLARLLVAADDPLCVCEFTPLVDVSESAISHALSDLTEAGLATREKDGQWRYYSPTERTERLLATLDDTRGR